VCAAPFAYFEVVPSALDATSRALPQRVEVEEAKLPRQHPFRCSRTIAELGATSV